MKHDWRRRGAINDAHSPMVTGQIIYDWLLRRHVLYISMIYLSLLIHILVATRIHIKKENRKKHLTTSLSLPNSLCLQGFSLGRYLAKRSLNTSPNTSLILFCIYSIPEHDTSRNLMNTKKKRGKVTCWVRCWVRCLANTSLSEPPVNKGISEGKVRWGGLFWNSPQKSECSTRRGTYCPMGYSVL